MKPKRPLFCMINVFVRYPCYGKRKAQMGPLYGIIKNGALETSRDKTRQALGVLGLMYIHIDAQL